jgi:branched-chain amino acid transport system substrate-binding protein
MKQKKLDRRTFIKGLGVTGIALSTIGFPAILRSAAVKEVEIATVMPLSGPAGAGGTNSVRGWEIAIEEINAEGGIKSLGGAKLKSVVGDTQGNPRIGMAEIEKVARNKNIPVVVGCWQSAVTFPATQVSEQYGLSHIVCVATQPQIMERGFKYVFRINVPSDRMNLQLVESVVDFGKKTGHVAKRAAVISLDDSYGISSSTDFKNALKKMGQELVEEIYYPVKVTNVDVEIAKLKAAKPDVVYATSSFIDASLIVKALHAQKVNVMGWVTGGSGYLDPKFLESVGLLANYIFAVAVWNYNLSRPMEQSFDAKMRAKHGIEANAHSALAYSAVYVIKDALERAGTIDRDKFRDALEATNITSGKALLVPAKYIKFDEKHENPGCHILQAQCLDGKYRVVWPDEFKGPYKPVWPMPKWEER